MFDYVIVGGGSAGCVLANRLSAHPDVSVCLIEAGPPDTSPFIRMPTGIIPLFRSRRYNWQFWTTPQTAMNGRRMYWPRGRTLGGSSAINAMCYVRGHASDYDHWAALGNTGWSYADVLPLFRATEHYEPGADAWHGQGGPLNVAAHRARNPLCYAFVEAARQAGLPENPDFNGREQAGVGWYDVFQKDGERCSNAHAFLAPVRDRDNLTVITDAHVARVLIQADRATGVELLRGDTRERIEARSEVILAAGAIGSPQLLMLSGIGSGEQLRQHGITPRVERPAVGRNLQDHLDVVIEHADPHRLSMSYNARSLGRSVAGLRQYARWRSGELTSNVAEAGAFLRSTPDADIPDVQMHFVPITNSVHTQRPSRLFAYGYTLMACFLRPYSRGSIQLASADPRAAPLIDPNYLDDARDLPPLIAGIRRGREILAQSAFDGIRGDELAPGAAAASDIALETYIRATAETIYHPVGTCRMGVDDAAVVDPRLRVYGVDGLRVIDASVMPTLVGGNTNAPTTMIAEKGARMVLADAGRADQGLASAA